MISSQNGQHIQNTLLRSDASQVATQSITKQSKPESKQSKISQKVLMCGIGILSCTLIAYGTYYGTSFYGTSLIKSIDNNTPVKNEIEIGAMPPTNPIIIKCTDRINKIADWLMQQPPENDIVPYDYAKIHKDLQFKTPRPPNTNPLTQEINPYKPFEGEDRMISDTEVQCAVYKLLKENKISKWANGRSDVVIALNKDVQNSSYNWHTSTNKLGRVNDCKELCQ